MAQTFRNIRDEGIIRVETATDRLALLPSDGTVVLQLDTDTLYVWNAPLLSWINIASSSGSSDSFTTMQTDTGTYPTATTNADTLTFTTDDINAYLFDGNALTDTVQLIIEDAGYSNRGLVNTTSQTFKGDKILSNYVQDAVSFFTSLQLDTQINNTAGNSSPVFGLFSNVNKLDNFTDTGSIFGVVSQVSLSGNGDVGSAVGVQAAVRLEMSATTNLTNAYGLDSYIYNGSSETITNANVIKSGMQNSGGGSVTYGKGILVNSLYGDNTITGFQFESGGSGNTNQLIGIDVQLNSTSTQRPVGFNSNNGVININGEYRTQSNIFVDSLNLISATLHVDSGTPIAGTDIFACNIPGLLQADDDLSVGPLGIGFTSVGFVSQFAIASGKTVDLMQGALGGFSVAPTSTGGTVTDSICFNAFGVIDLGLGGTVNITNAYAYIIRETILDFSPTNAWGFYSDFAGIKHLLGGDAIGIGGTSLGDYWKFDNLNQVTDVIVDHVLEDAEKLKPLNFVSTIDTNAATATLGFVNAVFDATITGNDDISGSADAVGGLTAKINVSGDASTPPVYGLLGQGNISGSGMSQGLFGAVTQANSTGNGAIATIMSIQASANVASATVGDLVGIYANPVNSGGTVSNQVGVGGQPTYSGTSTQANLIGVAGYPVNDNTGTVTEVDAFDAQIDNAGGGAITNAYGYKVSLLNGTNKYGFHNALSGQGVQNLFTQTEINEVFTDDPDGSSLTVNHSDIITGNITNSFTAASIISLNLNGDFDRTGSFGIGQNVSTTLNDDSDIAYLVGALNQTTHLGDGLVSYHVASVNGAYLDSSTGGISDILAGTASTVEVINGTANVAVALVAEVINSGGTITDGFVLRCETLDATNKYGFFIDIGTSENYLSGGLEIDQRLQLAQGSNIAAANNLTLGAGNTFTITGNTTINAITTTGWKNGSSIVLKFTGTPTVKHNTTGGAGTAVIKLAGSSDFSAVNDAILRLTLIDGEWQEEARKVP